jgi:hypothetical protein
MNSDSIAQFRALAAPFPQLANYQCLPEVGTALPIDRVSRNGRRVAGVSINVKVLAGPFTPGTPIEEMTPGGALTGRNLTLSFHTEHPKQGLAQREMGLLVKIGDAAGVVGKLPPEPTVVDLVEAIAARFTPTKKNPTPPRLLLKIERSTPPDGLDCYAAIDAMVAAPLSIEGDA